MNSKSYLNKTDQLFFLNAINRKISSSKSMIHTFTEEEMGKEPLLRQLIKGGYLAEVFETEQPSGDFIPLVVEDYQSQPNNIETKPSYRQYPAMHGEIEKSIADPIGHSQSQVSIDPSGMSRFAEDRPPRSIHENLAIDPSKMSRFQETQDSLLHNTNASYDKENQSTSPPQQPAQSSVQQSIHSFDTSAPPLPPMPDAKAVEAEMVKHSNQQPSIQSTELEAWWCGPANDASGYGKMNRHCLEGLHKKGMKIELDLFKIPDFRSSVPITPSMDAMIKNKVSESAPAIWGIMPPKYLYRGRKKVLFTMMETSEVPVAFLEKCNQADELWLPSIFNMEMFERAKAKPKLVHMPLGVDTELYKPMELTEEQRKVFSIKMRSFVFVSLFGWSLRKGVDILFRSYLEEFTCDDDVTLLVASRKDGSSGMSKNGEIREQIRSYIDRWCPDPSKRPHIVHIGEAMPEESLPILFNLSDCFVLPSRGEGYCLPMAEAGSSGLPVIATRCGGQLDFLNDENSYLLDIEGFEIGSQEIRAISSYYQDAPFAVLGDKTKNQLKEIMRYVLNNKAEAKAKAGNLRKNIENNFTWNHLVDKVYNRIKSF